MSSENQGQTGEQEEIGQEPQAQIVEQANSINANREEHIIEEKVNEEGENQESVTQSDNLQSETESQNLQVVTELNTLRLRSREIERSNQNSPVEQPEIVDD